MIRRLGALALSATIHALVGLAIEWPGSTTVLVRSTPPTTVAVFLVPSPEAIETGLNPIDSTPDSMFVPRNESSTVAFPGFTFDFGKVTANASLLFPFLTPGLSPDLLTRGRDVDRSAQLRNPLDRSGGSSGDGDRRQPPLAMSAAALQSLIDKSWSRRDRWVAFQPIARLTESNDADGGRLADLIHEYVAQNALQPYVDTAIRDPRLWAQLALAADHARFIGFVSRYSARHASSRTTTELLFLLDTTAQGNFDVLTALLDTDAADQLVATRTASQDAFDLVVALQRHYRAELRNRNLYSIASIQDHYDRVRLQILSAILRTTPNRYRSSDANFLIGCIHWRRRNTVAALQAWSGMTIDSTDRYVTLYSELLTVLRKPAGGRRDRDIDRIVNNVRGQWLTFSFDRLRHFGYRFDTF